MASEVPSFFVFAASDESVDITEEFSGHVHTRTHTHARTHMHTHTCTEREREGEREREREKERERDSYHDTSFLNKQAILVT